MFAFNSAARGVGERVQCRFNSEPRTKIMKYPGIAGIVLIWVAAVAQTPKMPVDVEPDSGSVHGVEYKSDFFGFTYAFPKDRSVLHRQSHAGIVVLAESISESAIRDSKDAASRLVDLLSHTEPPHTMLLAPQKVFLDGKQFYRLEYEQQTFPTVKHRFCTVVGVLNGYALRFSMIADTKDRVNEACATIASLRFYK